MLFKRKHRLDENIIKEIYKKGRLKRWAEFLLGVLIVAIAYNLFLLPAKVVYGVGGLGIIFNSLFKIDPSLVILVSSVILLFLSLILLGKEETKKTVIGSLLYQLAEDGVTTDSIADLTEDKLEEYLKKSNGYCAKSVLENGAIASYPTSL